MTMPSGVDLEREKMSQLLNDIEPMIFSRVALNKKIAYALVDEQAVILNVNDLMQRWIENHPELVGQNLFDVLPELMGWTEDLLTTVRANQESFTIPQIHRDFSNGRGHRYFDLQIEFLAELDGVFLITLVDITEQALLQQNLIHQRNELQLDIIRRERLEKERDRLIEDLTAFAHTVAHDLKGPLTNMMGYTELVDKAYGALPEEVLKRNLHNIAQNGRKMYAMIDSLLLLAEIRQVDVERNVLDMAAIVEEVMERVHLRSEEFQAEISLPESWPEAIGYAPWIEEVWTNYLTNAIKYGGRPPQIELGATPQVDNTVRFWVKDNGAGLSAEECAQLFFQFTRLGHNDAEGHGLGLSIVKRIMTKLGGRVGVESREGDGSIFSFTLPVSK